MIYLDYNATAPLLPEVKKAMAEHAGKALNPSSIHAAGREARKIIETARGAILKSVNARNLVFCGSASEANNMVSGSRDKDAGFFISAIEHESVFRSAKNAILLPVTSEGVVDLEDLKKILFKAQNPESRILLSVMLANNETGIIQPIKEIVALAREYNAVVHTDAVQAYGRVHIDFEELGVDLMTISSHKAGGPLGTAALIYRDGLELKPFIKGGGQEKNLRAGTENVLAIHGFGYFAKNCLESEVGLAVVNKYLEEKIKKLPGFVIVGEGMVRLPNTTCLIHPRIEAATQLIHFDMAGICVSSGSACSSGKVEVSRVLKVMDVANAKNAIRISTGWGTTKKDMDGFLAALEKLKA